MVVAIVILFQVLGIVSAVHAVLGARTPQGSIAWAVSLVTFPYVSVPAYWVFGRNKFQGYVLAKNQQLEDLQSTVRAANSALSGWETSSTGAANAAERLARVPLTGGNTAELLVDGMATFDSIFAGIDAAEQYVLVQFYIIRDDGLGRQLRDRLVAAAARGVRVYLLYDEIGSLGLADEYRQSLASVGVEVLPFHSRKGSGNRFQLNFRNHRKTVVVDGHSAWIGGHNVGDEYLGQSEEFGRWRDTHVRIRGPAVLGAQLAFIEDWRWASDQLIENLDWEPAAEAAGDVSALVISSGPADQLETASLMYTGAINAAESRIWIASPYFVPDDAVVQALQLAALRGVDVRILIPDKADSALVSLAAYTFFDEINVAGVNFYRYDDGFLHQKVSLVDDDVATIGTANFDNRSFRLNFEITAVVISEPFAAEVATMLEADFARARRMKSNEYANTSAWFKLKARVARLAAPVL